MENSLSFVLSSSHTLKGHLCFRAFAGHISVADRNRLDKFFMKSHRRIGLLVNQVFNISSLIDRFDSQLFRSIAHPDHCLHYLLRESAITQCCSDSEDTITP